MWVLLKWAGPLFYVPLVLCLFPLMHHANINPFLIYALSFSVFMPFGWLHSVMLTPTNYIISYGISFLGIFTKLWKVTISLVMTVHSSVHIEQLGSNWTDFHDLSYLSTVENLQRIQVSVKSDKNKRYFTWRPIHFWSYLAHFFLEWKMIQTKVVQKIKTHILCSITFFQELSFMR